jgi:hypothetical protein
MARNRRTQSAALRFGPALKACLLCLLIGGSGVGYVWEKSQIAQLGDVIKMREIHLRQLQDENERLRQQVANMRSPGQLQARIKQLKLGLSMPQPAQVLWLPDPVAETPKTTEPQLVLTVPRRPVTP